MYVCSVCVHVFVFISGRQRGVNTYLCVFFSFSFFTSICMCMIVFVCTCVCIFVSECFCIYIIFVYVRIDMFVYICLRVCMSFCVCVLLQPRSYVLPLQMNPRPVTSLFRSTFQSCLRQ